MQDIPPLEEVFNELYLFEELEATAAYFLGSFSNLRIKGSEYAEIEKRKRRAERSIFIDVYAQINDKTDIKLNLERTLTRTRVETELYLDVKTINRNNPTYLFIQQQNENIKTKMRFGSHGEKITVYEEFRKLVQNISNIKSTSPKVIDEIKWNKFYEQIYEIEPFTKKRNFLKELHFEDYHKTK